MRMWEIREKHSNEEASHYEHKDSAYKTGYEDGYADAMKEYRAFRDSDFRYR